MSPEPALDRTMTPDRLVGAADPARAMRFAANLARELHADLPLYACVLAYLQAACAFGAVVGAPQKFVPLLYLGVWLRYLGAVLFI